jgi:DNA-binding MarR family transcriptional regulator
MAPLAVANPSTQATLKENEKKWGKPLLRAGWSMIPTTILAKQEVLNLKANDVNVLMHLIAHWWYAERLPYPSLAEIAKRMGVDRSTVQRSVTKMVKQGLIVRNERKHRSRGQLANSYDLGGLIRKATPLAKTLIEEKTKAQEIRRLKVVRDD